MRRNDVIKRAAGIAGVALDNLLVSRTDSIGILVYHRIAESVAGVVKPEFNATPTTFASQLRGLQGRGFRFLALNDVLGRCRAGEPVPSKTVIVTFDDGYANNYHNAWPVLRQLEIPATIFLNTAYLDSDQPFPFDQWANEHQPQLPPEVYRPLTIAQCQEMLCDGLIELGAHTHTHRDFRGKPEELRADLEANVQSLRDNFDLEDISFAFPYGRVSMGYAGGALTEVAREVGVTCALTTECELNARSRDPFTWGRFNAYEWDTGATLAAKLAGWYGWAPRLQDRLVRAEIRQGGR